MVGPGPHVAVVRDIEIPGPAGPMGGRVYEPGPDPAGTVVYYHGGLGHRLRGSSGMRPAGRWPSQRARVGQRRLPARTRALLPCRDGRCVRGTRLGSRAVSRQRDRGRGDSAGGNLAAVAALRARDAGGPEIALQVLVYPVVDCDLTRPSYAEYTDTKLILNTPEMAWFWDHYVPNEAEREHPYASPIRASTLAGLPPAYIVIAQHDPLRDEGLAYAAALKAANVPVTVARYDDQIHAFFTLVNLMESADRAVAEAGLRSETRWPRLAPRRGEGDGMRRAVDSAEIEGGTGHR